MSRGIGCMAATLLLSSAIALGYAASQWKLQDSESPHRNISQGVVSQAAHPSSHIARLHNGIQLELQRSENDTREVFNRFRRVLEQADQPSLSSALHLLRLVGPTERCQPWGLNKPLKISELLLRNEEGSRVFGSAMLYKTRNGLRYMTQDSRGSRRADEAHRDQVLASFAEVGIALDYPVRVSGHPYEVRDILSDSIAEFHLGQAELAWTAQAYAIYLAPQRIWRNRYGEEFNFDALANELIERPLAGASCGGAHILTSLLTIEAVDHKTTILSAPTRKRLKTFTASCLSRLGHTQLKSGAWPPYWHGELQLATKGDSLAFGDEDAPISFLVTSHLVEALLVYRRDDPFARAAAEKAANWLKAELLKLSEEEMRSNICPCTHALVAVLLCEPDDTGLPTFFDPSL